MRKIILYVISFFNILNSMKEENVNQLIDNKNQEKKPFFSEKRINEMLIASQKIENEEIFYRYIHHYITFNIGLLNSNCMYTIPDRSVLDLNLVSINRKDMYISLKKFLSFDLARMFDLNGQLAEKIGRNTLKTYENKLFEEEKIYVKEFLRTIRESINIKREIMNLRKELNKNFDNINEIREFFNFISNLEKEEIEKTNYKLKKKVKKLKKKRIEKIEIENFKTQIEKKTEEEKEIMKKIEEKKKIEDFKKEIKEMIKIEGENFKKEMERKAKKKAKKKIVKSKKKYKKNIK